MTKTLPLETRREISQTRLERRIPNGWLGRHHSNETRAKISETRRKMIHEGVLLMPTDKRNPSVKETIAKIRVANRGQQRSLEVRQKMSEAQKQCGNRPPSMKGIKHSDTFKQKCSVRRGKKAPWYGRHHSIVTRMKLSKQRRGKRGVNWQGGLTPITESARHTIEFKLWREAIFARDNWTCQGCGQKGRKLHPHHIKSFAKYPELRFNIENGITLCEDCHKRTKNFGGMAIVETEMARTEQVFLPYMMVDKERSLYEAIRDKHFLLEPGEEGK